MLLSLRNDLFQAGFTIYGNNKLILAGAIYDIQWIYTINLNREQHLNKKKKENIKIKYKRKRSEDS